MGVRLAWVLRCGGTRTSAGGRTAAEGRPGPGNPQQRSAPSTSPAATYVHRHRPVLSCKKKAAAIPTPLHTLQQASDETAPGPLRPILPLHTQPHPRSLVAVLKQVDGGRDDVVPQRLRLRRQRQHASAHRLGHRLKHAVPNLPGAVRPEARQLLQHRLGGRLRARTPHTRVRAQVRRRRRGPLPRVRARRAISTVGVRGGSGGAAAGALLPSCPLWSGTMPRAQASRVRAWLSCRHDGRQGLHPLGRAPRRLGCQGRAAAAAAG